MTSHNPPTTQQLDDIEARVAERLERYAVAIHDAMEPDLSLVDQEPAYQALIARAAEAAVALADTEVRRLNAELADQQAETEKLIRWHGEDETAMKQMRGTIERLRGEKRELGELAARRESELIARRDAMEKIRHLHKDSPMGPCPVCINADAGVDEDPTVPWPCPTARLAGAVDIEPPHVPAAAGSV